MHTTYTHRHRQLCLVAPLVLSLASTLVLAAEPAPKLTNAALAKYGALYEVPLVAKDVVFDKKTSVDAAFDGNPHSRYVVTGVPYTFIVDLTDKLPIDRIAITHSDYAGEAAAKDIEIKLDDGPPIAHTLELKPPTKGKPEWQDIPLAKSAKRIAITVKSNYEGKVRYGGIGDIAVWTSADLDSAMKVPDYDSKSPTFVHIPPIESRATVKVTLPPVAKAGEHPCVLMTKAEVPAFKAAVNSSERGKAALGVLLAKSDTVCASGKLDFPDPKGPLGQLKRSGDVIAKQHDRLSMDAGDLGVSYLLTGDIKYANRAAEILRGYAERYPQYPEHKGVNGADTGKVMSQRLSEAMWLMPLAAAYDQILDSGVLTDADKKLITNDLFRTCVTFIRRSDPAAEVAKLDKQSPTWRTTGPTPVRNKQVGNWMNFYAAATLMSGAAIEDRNYVDIAAYDYKKYIQSGIGDDGMWGEGAIGYQLFAIRAMSVGMEAAARQGIDLWGFDDARFKLLFDSPLWYMYPDSTAPGINDSSRTRIGDWSTMSYDYAALRYGDTRYASLINTSPRQLHYSTSIYLPTVIYAPQTEPAAVTYPSQVFSNLGYAVLRDKTRYTLLKYGPHGGPHGHPDKLNVIVFSGDELGGEPKFHLYDDPLHGSWTKQTLAHNTMTVDQRKQGNGEGRLLVFEDAAPLQVMRAEVAGIYPGVLFDRTIVVTPGAVLDIYRGASGKERTWDRTLRYQGQLEGLTISPNPTTLSTQNGYENFQVHQKVSADAGWRGTWLTKPGKLELAVAGAPGQTAYLGTGADKENMTVIRQVGKQVTFAQALQLDSWGDPITAATLLDSGNADVALFELKQKAATTRVYIAYTSAPWKALDAESDARVLCITQQGSTRRILLTGGKQATVGDAKLSFDTAGNYSAVMQDGKTEVVTRWTSTPHP